MVPSAGHAMGIRFSVEIGFTDANGRYWIRSGIGHLVEVKVSPTDYYGISRPIPWEYPASACSDPLPISAPASTGLKPKT
jgi:hypothetical protein